MLSAERNAKFRSNQTEADQFTVENVILSAEVAAGDIKLTALTSFPSFIILFFFLPLIIISAVHIPYVIVLCVR